MIQQYSEAAKRAITVLGSINKSWEVIVLHYSPLIKVDLEYCTQFLLSQYKKDAEWQYREE